MSPEDRQVAWDSWNRAVRVSESIQLPARFLIVGGILVFLAPWFFTGTWPEWIIVPAAIAGVGVLIYLVGANWPVPNTPPVIPKVEFQTIGRTLVFHLTEAQQNALFEMWLSLRDDTALSEVHSRLNRACRDARDHEYSAWGISSMEELKIRTACMTCGLEWGQHRHLQPPYDVVLNISEDQYVSLSGVLSREAGNGPIELEQARTAIAEAHSNAPPHRYGTSEVEQRADLRFRGDITCIVCGLSASRHVR